MLLVFGIFFLPSHFSPTGPHTTSLPKKGNRAGGLQRICCGNGRLRAKQRRAVPGMPRRAHVQLLEAPENPVSINSHPTSQPLKILEKEVRGIMILRELSFLLPF